MLAGQASAFNGTCRVWAPEYRQAALGSYWGGIESGRAALTFAYHDVARAFKQFLVEIGPGRPFVLASHSQGGHHMCRLLEEHVDRSPAMCGRMIACYMIGSRIPLDKFQRSYKNLRECASPTDHSGVVIGWDTLADKAEILQDAGIPNPGHWYATGWEHNPDDPVLGTNPISWTPTAAKGVGKVHDGWLGQLDFSTNLGRQVGLKEYLNTEPIGITKVFDLRRSDPTPVDGTKDGGGQFWAESRLDRVAVPECDLTTMGVIGPAMLGGFYHCADYSLFYFNIRANVRERVKRYLRDRR